MKKHTSNNLPAAPKPQKDALEVLTTDEHAGRGGSYVFDPAAGTRIPVSEPQTEKE